MIERPLSVQQIVEEAQNFDYNPLVPLKYWLRTANTLLQEAGIYEREGKIQQTYLLLFRHAQLVLSSLRTHPDARQIQHRFNLQQAERAVQKSLAKLEVLKPRINARHQRYEQLRQDRDAQNARGNAPVNLNQSTTKSSSKPKNLSFEPATASDTEPLAAADHRDLAVQLAHIEIRRRATAKKTSRHAGVTGEPGMRTAKPSINQNQTVDDDTLRQQMQNLGSQLNGKASGQMQGGNSMSSFENQRLIYRYPTVPEKRSDKSDFSTICVPKDTMANALMEGTPAPGLPPKEKLVGNETPIFRTNQENSLTLDGSARLPSPPPKPDLKPSTFTFKPSAYLENGSPLRTIFLPPNLRHQFLKIALSNTQANLETCGVLCGTLISNALFISKLVIPDQESTSDTCETINEDKLFEYVDGEDLMVLGWIHTHPTQTCFMSSRDLHTHAGYQAMMPESIAIVCAPSKGDWGVFRLTDPPGMKSVLGCTKTGLFHPHDETNIYTDALRPGHVYEAEGLRFDIVDLRQMK